MKKSGSYLLKTKNYDTVQAAAGRTGENGISFLDNRPASVVQRKDHKTGLPDNLKSGIEHLSGHSMDDVKVHYNSAQPAQLNAHAYAQGTDIHIAPGQEKHLPHEAWHVVQQKQGRVKPTIQLKGKVNINDDKSLENEADIMGSRLEKEHGQNPAIIMGAEEIGGLHPLLRRTATGKQLVPASASQLKKAPPLSHSFVVQRMKITDTQKKDSKVDLPSEKWTELGEMIDEYEIELKQLNWYHGTTSSSLLIALMSDGTLKSAADLLKEGLVPLSGESGFALHPNSINKKGASGVDLKHLDYALKYTKPQQETHLKVLFPDYEKIISKAKTVITKSIDGNQSDPNQVIQNIRAVNLKLSRFVWSEHLYGNEELSKYEPMADKVREFEQFLNFAYQRAKEHAKYLLPELENIVLVFNKAREKSLEVRENHSQRMLVDKNFPVVYAAKGNSAKRKESDIPGESILKNPNFPSASKKSEESDDDSQIRIIFAPWSEISGMESIKFKLKINVLPLELIQVYQIIMHPNIVMNLPNFKNINKKIGAILKAGWKEHRKADYYRLIGY